MNSRQELQQAFDDFQAGRLGTIPTTARERTKSADQHS